MKYCTKNSNQFDALIVKGFISYPWTKHFLIIIGSLRSEGTKGNDTGNEKILQHFLSR